MSSSMVHPPRRHPALITELLSLIFSFLDERSAAKLITVSRQWAEVAIDFIWRDVIDIRRLLTLLSPLCSEKQPAPRNCCSYNYVRAPSFSHSIPNQILCRQKFKRGLLSSDWDRFDRYARHIRQLTYDDRRRRYIDPSVWREIARTRPRQDLLPNLQSLVWFSTTAEKQHHSLLFMHSRVTRLSVNIHPSPLSFPYIQRITSELPRVLELELRSESPMRDIEQEVVALLRGLPSLRRIYAPMYSLTAALVSELSHLRELSDVVFGKPVEQGTGDRADVATFTPRLEDGAFPALQTLCFSAHLIDATEFISSPFTPTNLSHLYVHILAVDDAFVLQDFFTIISRRFHHLTEFHVDFVISPDAPIVYPPPPITARPTIQTFRPLFSCKRLRVFEFRWDYQMNLSQHDIEEMASSWPSIEVLLLNCQPIPETTRPLLTLRALTPFARFCPNLRELGLYLDADPTHLTKLSLPLNPFKSLEVLSVGASSIYIVEPVALFLSNLCPLNCQIISGVRWPDAYGIALDRAGIYDERRVNLTEFWVRWNDLSKVLPLAIKARMEEKDRMVGLQREIEALSLSRQKERERVDKLENELRDLRYRSARA